MSISENFPGNPNLTWHTLFYTCTFCFSERPNLTKKQFSSYVKKNFFINLSKNDCTDTIFLNNVVDFATEYIYPIAKITKNDDGTYSPDVVIKTTSKLYDIVTDEKDKKSLDEFLIVSYLTVTKITLFSENDESLHHVIRRRNINSVKNIFKDYHRCLINILEICKKNLNHELFKYLEFLHNENPDDNIVVSKENADFLVNEIYPELKDIIVN